jgi:uncharacterized protein YxeA
MKSPFNEFNQKEVKRLLLYDEPKKSKTTKSNSKRKQKNYGVGRTQFQRNGKKPNIKFIANQFQKQFQNHSKNHLKITPKKCQKNNAKN